MKARKLERKFKKELQVTKGEDILEQFNIKGLEKETNERHSESSQVFIKSVQLA